MALVAVLVLSGCAPAGHPSGASGSGHGSGSGSASASGSAAPTTSPSPSSSALPSNALLRMTATVTASTGAVARLVETAYAPSAGDGSELAAMSAAGCDDSDWKTLFPAPQWVRVTETATLISGSSWPAEDAILINSGNAYGVAAWSGDQTGFEAACADGIVTVPGTAQAVLPVEVTPVSDQKNWFDGPWGFEWAEDVAQPSDMHFAFTGCTIEAGPAAGSKASLFVRHLASGGFAQMCSMLGSV